MLSRNAGDAERPFIGTFNLKAHPVGQRRGNFAETLGAADGGQHARDTRQKRPASVIKIVLVMVV
jgi:hypothetical protein